MLLYRIDRSDSRVKLARASPMEEAASLVDVLALVYILSRVSRELDAICSLELYDDVGGAIKCVSRRRNTLVIRADIELHGTKAVLYEVNISGMKAKKIFEKALNEIFKPPIYVSYI